MLISSVTVDLLWFHCLNRFCVGTIRHEIVSQFWYDSNRLFVCFLSVVSSFSSSHSFPLYWKFKSAARIGSAPRDSEGDFCLSRLTKFLCFGSICGLMDRGDQPHHFCGLGLFQAQADQKIWMNKRWQMYCTELQIFYGRTEGVFVLQIWLLCYDNDSSFDCESRSSFELIKRSGMGMELYL
jgi:hypothetical protein